MSQRAPGDERCKDCSDPHEPDKSRCAPCAERHRQEASALTKARRKACVCVTCGGKVTKRLRDGEPSKYCKTHAAYYAARAAR